MCDTKELSMVGRDTTIAYQRNQLNEGSRNHERSHLLGWVFTNSAKSIDGERYRCECTLLKKS